MLSKQNRLTKRGSFSYVYKKGDKKSLNNVTLIFVKAKSLKVGFSVNNKVGKAVVRNKLKRRLRAIVRAVVKDITPAQIVITVRPEAAKLSFDELNLIVLSLLNKSALIKSKI